MIHGHSRGRYLDDKFFWPILERAEELGVPIYLHPTPLPEPVIKSSYVGNYSREVTSLFSIAGWGWHTETAPHVMRVILGGAFDAHPKLQLIVGHLGEGLPFMMPRIERVFHPPSEAAEAVPRRCGENPANLCGLLLHSFQVLLFLLLVLLLSLFFGTPALLPQEGRLVRIARLIERARKVVNRVLALFLTVAAVPGRNIIRGPRQ
jgi:hypothetical protein